MFIDIPSEWFRLPEAEAEACRVQRLSYERERRRDKADEMFVRERRALRRAEVRRAREEFRKELRNEYLITPLKFAQVPAPFRHLAFVALRGAMRLKALLKLIKAYAGSFTELLLADLSCGYGTSWLRPIFIWVLAVLGLFPSLYWLTGSIPSASDPWDYLCSSVLIATTLGYGDAQPTGVGRALTSAEAIFGTFMWAVFLAVFARKYMR